ncbi:MAG TPA: hypothetical protein ENH66_01335, partial [Candidatus Nealsonbacteria bacterium]|nr:hypothetical protein [Candidatus Nealsonbacteria bacterium]
MDPYIINFNKSLRLGLISFAKREKKRFLLSLLIFSFLVSYSLAFLPLSILAANPAAEIQTKVRADHPEAVVVERNRNSIKHRIADAPDGRQRFTLDVSIGPLHYGPDNDQEIDTAFVPSTVPWDWEMTKADFEVRALSQLNAGRVVEYRKGTEWVRFQPMALQYSNDLGRIQQIAMPQAVDAVLNDDTLTWTDGYGPGLDFSWQVQ